MKNVIPGSENIEEFICVVCQYVTQLFARSEKWTKENILGYLTSSNRNYVQAAWEGLMVGLHDFSIPFATAILPIFQNNIETGRNLRGDLKNQFIYDYVMLLVYIVDDPLEYHIGQILKGSTEADRHQFARSIYMVLENMKTVQRSELWNRRLKEYWELRINNTPEKLCSEELGIMLNWVLLLQDEYEEVVDLLLRSECNEPDSYILIRDLKNSDIVKQHPQKTGELLIYLLQHNGMWMDRQVVDGLFLKLKSYGLKADTIEKIGELIQRIYIS